jgi:FKBP-type peptidyl-prolyl cis-trans isomerase
MNMMKIHVLIGLLLLCVACKNSEKETPSGLKFTVIKAGNGVLPKKEDIVVFDFVMKDSKDSVWNDTHEAGMPGVVMIADSATLASEDGMTQMFRMLSKGDSVRVTLPMKKFFSDLVKAPIPPTIDSTLSISYFIQVRDIMKMDQFRQYQTELMEKKKERQKKKDDQTIAKYLSEKNIKAQIDTSGIHYVIHKSSGGQKPTDSSCVEVDYSGKFMKDGRLFDQNKIAFSLTQVIPGWRIAIPMLGIGDSGTFYIPSGLAYGPQGYPGAIPPDAILIFDVKLLGTGNAVDEKTRTCK